MKATGRELIDGVATDIRIYYCGHDANYKNVCDFEEFVKLLLTLILHPQTMKEDLSSIQR